MKTNHLQSIKQANKQTINDLHYSIDNSAKRITALLRDIRAKKAALAKKVDQQKQVKADISAAKTPRAPGSRRKHNKSDPRYVAWYTSSHAARNESVAVSIGNIPVAVACGC